MTVTEIDILAATHPSALTPRDAMMALEIGDEPCPLGGVHDFCGEMVNAAGFSCIKCHKTWDRQWRPTYSE